MAPKVTKSNNSTTVRPATVKKKPTPKKIDIAKAMMQFAEQNTGAIGKDGFQSLLKQVNKSNVIDVIKQYDKISPKKSIIAMILGETGSNDEEMENALTGKGNGKTAVRGLFTLLLDKAKDVGVDSKTIETYKKEFEKELDAQLGNNSILGQIRSLVYTDSSKLDTIMRALVQTIDNQTQLSTDEKVKISNTPATKMQAETNNVLVKRYNTALKNFNAQLKQDGWAGDVADGFSKIWNSDVGDSLGISTGNTADRVRKDLNACKKDLDALKQARQQGDAAYRAKFQEIFKVAYNPANIVAYQKAEERYIGATKAKAQEDSFKSQFSLLLNAKGLREEGTNMISPTTGGGTYIVTATKDQVFQREKKKLLDLMGEGGKALLESKYKEAGAKTNDDKFKVLQTLTKAVATKLGNDTKLACGGASYDSVQRQFDNCYKAAYGLENDIMKRVNDYNISQQKGAGVVKGATVMAIVTACALTGQVEGIVAVAGVAAGTTAVVEVTDAASQKRNIDAFKKGGLGAYLKSVGENTDWGGIAKASLTSGAMMLAIGGASYPIANLCRISASAAGLTGKALDIATGLGTNAAITGGVLGSQYLMKGEITTEDAVFAVVMAIVGSTIQVLQINKAYAQAESAAVDAHVQNIQDARRTLGFEDGVEITPDMLKQQYKKMALANHPDRGGSNVNMAVINSANEFLQAHIADINISLTGARPQTINPTIEAAKGNTTPQSTSTTSDVNNTALVARENLMEFRNRGYNLSTTPQNQIIAYTPEGKAVEVGTLGKTPLVEVKTNLSQIEPGELNVAAFTPKSAVETPMLEELPSSRVRTQYNTVAKTSPEAVGKEAEAALRGKDYRIATAGYSAPPEGYEVATTDFMRALNAEMEGRAGYVTSPTADKGSIDAITSEVAGMEDGNLFYVTAEDYVPYIAPENFPSTIDVAAYSAKPKAVLPDAASYSQATAQASNAFVATGGRGATVSDFCNAIAKGNKSVILDNTSIEGPAWGPRKPGKAPEVLNASKYLKEQIEAFLAGKELPYPESGNFTKAFMEAHRAELNDLVKVVTTDGTQASSQAAAVETANFFRSAEAPSSRAAAKFNTVAKTSPEVVGKEAEAALRGKDYRIATAGYSAPPEGYEVATTDFMRALNTEMEGRAGYVTSPTADKGSIDAITSEVAGMEDGNLFYVTAEDYVPYIAPENFPSTIDVAAYSAKPKAVLPDAASYSQATAQASNAFVATGGRGATVSDFCNAIAKGNKSVILDNTSIEGPAWGPRKPGKAPEVLNASKYLKEQIEAFLAGKELPYPESGNFTKAFMEAHRAELNDLVKVVTTNGTQASSQAAAVEASKFIKSTPLNKLSPTDYTQVTSNLKTATNIAEELSPYFNAAKQALAEGRSEISFNQNGEIVKLNISQENGQVKISIAKPVEGHKYSSYHQSAVFDSESGKVLSVHQDEKGYHCGYRGEDYEVISPSMDVKYNSDGTVTFFKEKLVLESSNGNHSVYIKGADTQTIDLSVKEPKIRKFGL